MTIRSAAFDFDSMPPKKREELIALGKRFSEFDVRAQVSKAREARPGLASLLEPHGVTALHWSWLETSAEEQAKMIETRSLAQVDRKTTSAKFHDALSDGKRVRVQYLPLLQGAHDTLSLSGDEAARRVRVVLDSISNAGWRLDQLQTQLKLMDDVLGTPAVADVVDARHATEARKDIAQALTLASTAQAEHTVPLGTPEQTARLNLLDGFLVTLLRQMRRAARAAARKHGRPEIAKAFELDKLYSSARRPAQATAASA